MLSSSESDPFTTTAPPSPPRSGALAGGGAGTAAATIIHGFPKERHSFRNVDRVRQRFKTSKGFHHHQEGEEEDVNNGAGKKRKFKGKSTIATTTNASLRSSGPGSGSVTESAHISASTVPSRIQMWEDEEEEEGKRRKDELVNNTEMLSRYALETAKQMESSSVGRRIIPSSPTTGRDRRDLSKPGEKGKEKLHRRRTFAGLSYTQAQEKKNLPHIDLLSKLPRSSSASPALIRAPVPAPAPAPVVAFQKRKSVTVSSKDISKTLVLHRLSRKRRGEESSLGQGHSRRSSTNTLSHSISRTLPNKTIGGGPITTTEANDNPGISLTDLSSRSLELLLENGLILIFKKLEVNHGFSNDTVKRAWLRCNGDIEATDHLLLTMRKAAEKAQTSFLGDDEYLVAEESDSEDEDEEEKKRIVKRPRWSEPHISSYSSSPITTRSVESIDSRYAPHLSSDREFTIYPEEEEEYTPPVGTKAEMFRRLTEQGRHEDARKILMMKSSRKSISSNNSTPVLRKGVERGVVVGVNESPSGGRISLKKHETTIPSLLRKTVSGGKVVEDTTTPTTRETNGIREKPIQQNDDSLSLPPLAPIPTGTMPSPRLPFSSPNPSITTREARTQQHTRVAPINDESLSLPPVTPIPTRTTSSPRLPFSSPNPSIITREARTQQHTRVTPIHQHDEENQNQFSSRGKQTTTPFNNTNTNNKTTQTENPSSSTMKSTSNGNGRNNSRNNNDTNWTLSDEEMLANSLLGKSQLDKLSVKYGEQDVLKRFLKIVKARG